MHRLPILPRTRVPVTLAALLSLAVAAACAGDGAPPIAPDTMPDATPDAAPGVAPDGAGRDANRDASRPGDVPDDTLRDALQQPETVSPPGDTATVGETVNGDGRTDAGVVLSPLPAWATVEEGARLVVRTADRAVHVLPLADGAVRVVCTTADGAPPERSWALVAPAPAAPAPVFGARDGDAAAATADWTALVGEDGALRVEDADGRTLVEDALPCAVTDAGVRVTRRTPAEEAFYGFGEKTGPLNKRGRRMAFWNTDPYDPAYGGYAPDADPIYQSIPFFVGLRDGVAYGVFTDETRRLEVDVAAADPSRYTIDTPGPALDQYVFVGPALADVVRRYTALTGRAPLPPRWALGLHQSRWGYSADRAREVAARYRAEGIPADVIWLDIQHMDGFRTFTWDPDQYPDPAAFVADLAALDFRTVVIADPCLKHDESWDIYAAALAGDHLLRHPDGRVYLGEAWPGACAFPDFTASATRRWWGDLVGRLLAEGVDGVWLDVNEPTTFDQPTVSNDVPVDGDGHPATMAEAHNVYALAESQATWEGFLRARPERRPFLLSRAGYAGIQRYAAVWTGDVPSTWHGLAESLPMMLNLGVSGVSFVGSDVGGYAGGASPELYARWLALGAVSPFYRVHTTRDAPDQEPWQFGTEVRDIARSVTRWRYGLLPYLYSLSAAAHETGAPILRPLVWHFPADPAARDRGDEALLGPWLLVAPVLEADATARSIHLPPGRWFELASGAVRDGGDFETAVTLAALPVWVREGAILPRRDPGTSVDDRAADPLYLDVYPGPEATSFALYEDEGDGFGHRDGARYARTRLALRQTTAGALLTGVREGAWRPPPRTVVVRVRRVDRGAAAVTLDDAPLPERASLADLLEAGEGWWWDDRDLALVAAFADRDTFSLTVDYDPTLVAPRPDVRVRLVVTVPADTPRDAPVTVATSANGWTHVPLEWGPGPNQAHGDVVVPRGAWFEYKYARGDWETVEKWPGCEEATNRYHFGQARPEKHDTVFGWGDWCE